MRHKLVNDLKLGTKVSSNPKHTIENKSFVSWLSNHTRDQFLLATSFQNTTNNTWLAVNGRFKPKWNHWSRLAHLLIKSQNIEETQ